MFRTEQELLRKQENIQREMSELLIKIREANGIENPFMVSRELNRSVATLRNIEKGIAFPTSKTLHELIDTYAMTPIEKNRVLKLKKEMLKVRRELKLARSKNGN
jgi:ribosome-binding protein aMBF1 (putative translation factor)